jgi:hypothetical protein
VLYDGDALPVVHDRDEVLLGLDVDLDRVHLAVSLFVV